MKHISLSVDLHFHKATCVQYKPYKYYALCIPELELLGLEEVMFQFQRGLSLDHGFKTRHQTFYSGTGRRGGSRDRDEEGVFIRSSEIDFLSRLIWSLRVEDIDVDIGILFAR